MKRHGHDCKVCGEYKTNEKFSGKGHAAHICKTCAVLPPEVREAGARAVGNLGYIGNEGNGNRRKEDTE